MNFATLSAEDITWPKQGRKLPCFCRADNLDPGAGICQGDFLPLLKLRKRVVDRHPRQFVVQPDGFFRRERRWIVERRDCHIDRS